jgi:hypothetical protein
MIKLEEIVIGRFPHNTWDVPTSTVDTNTWKRSYFLGYRKPRYPVPAIGLVVDWYPDPMIVIMEHDRTNHHPHERWFERACFWPGHAEFSRMPIRCD